ncbi:MAG TPA: hypothetical protein ENI57_12275 [Ignavibacteria bacterium]|nr:hypothetical protein [Ignavibacteria bacterium]
MKKFSVLFVTLLILSGIVLGQGKISSKIYFDYSYNKDAKTTNKFEIHRVYFTYQNKLSDAVSFKITTDVGRVNNGKDNRMGVYLKNALLKWKTGYGDIVLGLQGMNMFNVEEHNWGYRFVEKSPMDLYHFSSSADLGIGYYKTFNKKLHFSGLITNGTGYKKSENNNYKKISLQLMYGDSKITKDGNYNIGASFSVEPFDYVVGTNKTKENKIVFAGFAVYRIKTFRFGAEYDIMNNGGSSLSSSIISAYANLIVGKKVEVFARYDIFDPNVDKIDDGRSYIVGGLNIKPVKGFYIAPNVKISSPQKGSSTTFYNLNFQFKI